MAYEGTKSYACNGIMSLDCHTISAYSASRKGNIALVCHTTSPYCVECEPLEMTTATGVSMERHFSDWGCEFRSCFVVHVHHDCGAVWFLSLQQWEVSTCFYSLVGNYPMVKGSVE